MPAPDYVDLEKAKGFLRITHDNDDVFVASAISASSRGIDRTCHRRFGRLDTLTLLRYRAWYNRRDRLWTADIRDLWSATGLVVTVAGTTVTEYDLLPDYAAVTGRPWERIVFRTSAERKPTGAAREVGVLGLPGWAAIPDAVEFACLLQVSRFNARRSSPFGVAGSPQQGSEVRLLERLDPDVAVSLKDYQRMWVAA